MCNTCDCLLVKINDSTGLEKEKYIKALEDHRDDANREYKWEAGLNKLFIVTLMFLNADFISNFSLPHKCNTPNEFHWMGGMKIRPLIITHPGIDKTFCYLWSEIDGKKGAPLQ